MKGHTDATKVFTQACKKWADIINNMKLNATNFGFLRYEKNRKQNLQQLTNHIMIQSTTTKNKSVLCTDFHSSYWKYSFKRLETSWDGVESVSVAEALSYANTLEISCHSPTRVLLPAQTKNQKISKTWNTVIQYRQTETQQNPFNKMEFCIWASVVQLVAKISERRRKC